MNSSPPSLTDPNTPPNVSVIPVFYSDALLADAHSFSPSARKPRHVVAAWQAAGLPISIEPIRPATEEHLALSHDPAYVRGILSGTVPNGFGNQLPEVARSLPWTTGAMLSAAHYAFHHGIACAPVSGFHHAHYDSAGGFCTFNGLTVTAIQMLCTDLVGNVLILDCDQHFGDGTEQIIQRLGLQKQVANITFGRWYDNPCQSEDYLIRLQDIALEFDAFDLVLYQAGADVHIDDPLGGVLDTEEMIDRDRIVFEAAHAHGVPLVWNLAGGYQDPISKVVALHTNTMRECIQVYCTQALRPNQKQQED